MNRDELAARLRGACAAVTAAQDELTEIDSHFGDADHGVTMTKIAQAIAGSIPSAGGIKGMLEDAAMEVMMINGGSAVPLWNTWLDGLAEAAPEGEELDAEGLKHMLGHALEELSALSKAKVGDKTMMDALIPATEAALACPGSEEEMLRAAAQAAAEGAEASRNFVSKFGRARSYGEATIGTPTPDQGFFAKGLGHTDWGMKNRISRLFSPETGNAVMLAFDHGYIMGSTAGLERLDVSIAPLCEYADVLMGTRGAIRSCIPPTTGKAVCLRATHDSSVLFEDMSQGSGLALDMEDALRMNAAALAIQCFVGGAGERDSLEALCRAADAGYKYGVPILGVTAVGKEMARTTQYFLLATRILAELGASAVKTYYCEDFEKVASACPVPIVIAGGKKLPEAEALEMAYRAMSSGARGVDMGRNIFQSEHPEAMCRAVAAVVHQGFDAKHAYEYYLELANA